MAGYQNKNGYSGGDLDNILYDHNWKATPKPISFSIDDIVWPGTEADGVYPSDSSMREQVGGFDFAAPRGEYQPLNLTLNFSFKGQNIYAQIQSMIDEEDAYVYLIPFVAQDSVTSGKNYHQYLLRVTQGKSTSSAGTTAYFQIRAVAQLS